MSSFSKLSAVTELDSVCVPQPCRSKTVCPSPPATRLVIFHLFPVKIQERLKQDEGHVTLSQSDL